MLSLLHIENIAVIESADIQFDKGFNALTGETGAGKSIVVDAIGAIIGERTSRDLIRTGARSALVNAVFTGLPPLAWFQENGGGPDEDGNLLIQREIQPDGSRHPFDQFITAKTPAGRWGEPDDIVGPCVFLASHASDFVNGQILYADGGILAYIGRQPK